MPIDVFSVTEGRVSISNDEKNLAIWASKGFFPKVQTVSIAPVTPTVPIVPAEIKLDSTITPPKVDVDTLQPAASDRFPEIKKNGKKKK
jgi:hypothetical protein